MSEINKENQNQNFSIDDFDHEDDLWTDQAENNDENLPDLELPLSEDEMNSEIISSNENSKQEEDISQDIYLEELKKESKTEKLTMEESEIKNADIEQKIVASEVKAEIIKANKEENSANQEKSIDEIEQIKRQLIQQQEEISNNINLLVKERLEELENKKQNLEITIEKLERRKERINREMKSSFAGISQDLAIRVQGFKDYLVGSLQDLAAAAEQLELSPPPTQAWENESPPVIPENEKGKNSNPQFVEKSFKEETRIIRRLLDQYRTKPDYYGPPWQLRRTFEPIHAERVSDWFFSQGGRGALSSMGSRLQNILIASAIISILYQLYSDRTRVLILADTPEKLGEWRRGLQDCLGISRSDFGPSRGIVLFETPEALVQKGDRIVAQEDLPLVIMDLDDDRVSLSLLKFPLWLAFAPQKMVQSQDYYY
ncbi:DUF3086 domain-containing protein [Cyanobacterium aponinum FACHB-4101]|uniref:DUF3086 domain-containing protein n=1 Tax=Cyanobacterium aponinum TaxID=379064 RepID=UPI0016807659|nr:DUF3086 domain-containing protein [Cyanobacterium aponinum]MBD2392966.1 DUF3086 domain-containing protein [Cyanobacterium aponinum FACHB-4101]